MEYEKLCREVERVMGRRLEISGDFDVLCEKIRQRTGERLSPTTLKRIWGYLHEEVQPRKLTLDVLARLTGYRNYEELACSDNRADSTPLLACNLTDKDLEPGQRVRVCWRPDRCMVIAYEGEGFFRVEEAVNTKISVGDTFTCRLIVDHEPLYLSSLTHNGESGLLYIAGREGGVVFEVLQF